MINISLHIQKLPPATWGGGGYSDLNFGQLTSEVSIWGWGGGNLSSQNFKCQDLPKFQFWGGGVYSDLNFGQLKSEVFIWGGGYSDLNFGQLKPEVFIGGGQVKTQSAKICLNFNWGGGGFL